MKTNVILSSFMLVFLLLGIVPIRAQVTTASCCAVEKTKTMSNENKLVLIWSSDDPMVANRVALMYPHAAKRNQWFEEVILVIWGPSAKLIADNSELQNKLAQMKRDGVIIKACIACANEYGVTDKLKGLGYEVIPMGLPLTEYLKGGYKVLTF